MRPTELLDTNLKPFCQTSHQLRYGSVKEAVSAAITGKNVSVTGLGRAIKGRVKEKHRIKRMDKLIGNYLLNADSTRYYQAISGWLLSTVKQPVILVDWSTITSDEKWHLLRASLSFHGRAITLFECVYEQKLYAKKTTHDQFLTQLKRLLPESCTPIIVTDAGFKGPWFRTVESLGWHWVCRIRGTVTLTRSNEDFWLPIKKLHLLFDEGIPTECGEFVLAKTSPHRCRIVALKKIPKGRKHFTKRALVSKDSNSRTKARSQSEPWMIATNLPQHQMSEKQLCNIYRQRMQIEESFRDLKSAQFGLGLEHSGSRSRYRLANLILIASLAHFVLLLIGLCAESQKLQYQFQANTVRHYRVLSFITLALRVLERIDDFSLSDDDILYAREVISEHQAAIFL